MSLLDHLITAISHQQVSCLCLLDLSAAFDTIDHSILLHHLSSWFGITDSALTWFKTYLTSRSFSVVASGFASSSYPLSCGVPQGSVLGPIPFNMYTTPLSTLTSSRSLNHHLYADDTQIFISFTPKTFTTAITQLQDTISDISSWMTANVQSLNPSKTEFMLIGLPEKISKISNPSLSLPSNHPITPTDSACNLGFIFDSSLTFAKQISSLSSAYNYHIHDLRHIRHILDLKTAVVIATSLVHSKLDYYNSLYLNLPQEQISRLQLLQNSLARAVTLTPKTEHITPQLKSLHWLKIEERIHYKIISLTYDFLHTSQPNTSENLSILNLLAPLVLPIISLYSAHPPPLLLKYLIYSYNQTAPILWNNLPKSMRTFSNTSPNSATTGQCSSLLLSLSKTQFRTLLKTFSASHTHLNLLSFSD